MFDFFSDIINEHFNYKKINSIGETIMRNCKEGIQLTDACFYKLLYTKDKSVKDMNTAKINQLTKLNFTRQAYESKENNIPLDTYKNVLSDIITYYKKNYCSNNTNKIIAIDGTYNNNHQIDDILNIGFFNITDNIPIDLISCGKEGKNQELKFATKYIKENMNLFENNIIVMDRLYFSYKFLNFIESNNLKYIVRVKGKGEYIKNIKKPSKHNPNYFDINSLLGTVRTITYENAIETTVHMTNTKKYNSKYQVKIKNDCVLVTNLLNDNEYADSKIMDLYRSRWDIEVFFKMIKSNFKFQYINEKETLNSYKKMYICEQIIMYVSKIIEKEYYKRNKIKKETDKYTYKINKTLLINSLYDNFLYKLLKNEITDEYFNIFCKRYIIILQNKKGRSFPRMAKRSFCKWYVKGYSNQTKLTRILTAIFTNSIDKLDKNMKSLMKRIISIDNKPLNEFIK